MIDLPNGWAIRSVESICERVTSGGTPSRRRPEFYTNGTIDWYKTGELRDRLLSCSEERITQEALDSSSAKIFPADTVLLALYGDGDTITTLGLLKKPGATNQACCAMIVNEQVADARYLFYALKHTRSDLLQRCVGGAQRNLSGKLVREHQIPVPPVREQRAIAAVLGCLDDKIEHNRRTSRSLEGLARAMFKAWFVDFEPVHAKAAGATAYPGMPTEVFASLPTTFTASPLGPVPERWEVVPFSAFLSERNERVGDRGLPAYSSTNDGVFPRNERFKKDLSASQSKNLVIRRGDLVFGLSREVLNYGFMHDDIGAVSPVYKAFRIDPAVVSPLHVEAIMRQTPAYFRQIIKSSSREGQGIMVDHLMSLCLVLPPLSVRQAFESVDSACRALVLHLARETAKLAEVRDYLLPLLLSGAVQVGEAQ